MITLFLVKATVSYLFLQFYYTVKIKIIQLKKSRYHLLKMQMQYYDLKMKLLNVPDLKMLKKKFDMLLLY